MRLILICKGVRTGLTQVCRNKRVELHVPKRQNGATAIRRSRVTVGPVGHELSHEMLQDQGKVPTQLLWVLGRGFTTQASPHKMN